MKCGDELLTLGLPPRFYPGTNTRKNKQEVQTQQSALGIGVKCLSTPAKLFQLSDFPQCNTFNYSRLPN